MVPGVGVGLELRLGLVVLGNSIAVAEVAVVEDTVVPVISQSMVLT